MRIVAINLGNYGSTGDIMNNIGHIARECGCEYYCMYPASRLVREKKPQDIIICSNINRRIAVALAYLTGYRGIWLFFSTIKSLIKIKKINPDVIHLHNLHNTYIHLPLLFRYCKKNSVKVVWTLHDCWSFTGQCPHFTMVKCDKWKSGCGKCPQINIYPASCIDRTRIMWKLKKKWFTNVPDMILITPSKWLSDLVKQSYLKDYPIKIINNGINLSVFKPTPSDFRKHYGIGKNIFIVLFVAFGWGRRKGLDVIIKLAPILDERFQIVVVGTDRTVDNEMPQRVISIHRTQNPVELAEIYTASDVFVNPTREEVLGLVNLEALACGTPVITFRTGGSPECIDSSCGIVVETEDIIAMKEAIQNVCIKRLFTEKNCIRRAQQFDMNIKLKEYVRTYGINNV